MAVALRLARARAMSTAARRAGHVPVHLEQRGSTAWMRWDSRPKTFLVIKKPGVSEPLEALRAIVSWLGAEWGADRVLVEPSVLQEDASLAARGAQAFYDRSTLSQSVDAVISLGGDGTILYANTLFGNERVPPVIAFALGTVGFLTPFAPRGYARVLQKVLTDGCAAQSRPRLAVQVQPREGSPGALGAPLEQLVAVNEVVVGRKGPAYPWAPMLQCYVDGWATRTGAGEGVILATATGSTAYNLSAGGPVVAPTVDATLLTPLSPAIGAVPAVIPSSSVVDIRVVRASSAPADPEAGALPAGLDYTLDICRRGFGLEAPEAAPAPGAAGEERDTRRGHGDGGGTDVESRPVWGSPVPVLGSSRRHALPGLLEGPRGALDDAERAVGPGTGNFGGWAAPGALARAGGVPQAAETATVSVDIDGKPGLELAVGDTLRVVRSGHPLITAAATSSIADWLHDITDVLNWNLRPNRRPAALEKRPNL